MDHIRVVITEPELSTELQISILSTWPSPYPDTRTTSTYTDKTSGNQHAPCFPSGSEDGQVPLQHRDRHHPHARDVYPRAIPDVPLKVLLARDVDAHAPVFEVGGGDFVRVEGNGGDDYV